jgi:saccharopine dehydrogenase (NAD+, L-lysine-forming)
MKIGIIKERKSPPDKRVPLIPWQCDALVDKFRNLQIVAEDYPERCYKANEYREKGIEIVNDLSDCDVILGIKEIPTEALFNNKTYFIFSHTIKKQVHNRKLLQAILKKNIRLIDYECLRYPDDGRILGFGRFAGIVGAYNGLMAYGKRYNIFNLKPAHLCFDIKELEYELTKVKLGPEKILVTGAGRVGHGVLEVMKLANIDQVSSSDFIHKNFKTPVFAQVEFPEYNRNKQGKPFDKKEFLAHPENFESDFQKFLPETDLLIAGHYWAPTAPRFFTREDMLKDDFNIKVIADISCDLDGPIPSTIRSTTIGDPFFGYDPETGNETDPFNKNSVTVMAVDNLPCELPRDASEDFGNHLLKDILPLLMEGDKENILKNATIAEHGKLTEKFSYLQDYVDAPTSTE